MDTRVVVCISQVTSCISLRWFICTYAFLYDSAILGDHYAHHHGWTIVYKCTELDIFTSFQLLYSAYPWLEDKQ